jgi:Divergent InlB B-repeat domain
MIFDLRMIGASLALCLLTLAGCGGSGDAVTGLVNPDGGMVSLVVNRAGLGSVTADSGALTCPQDCDEVYPVGTKVTLTAAAETGYSFTGWSGSGVSCGSSASCELTLSESLTVTATFSQDAATQRELNVVVNGSGAVSSVPAGIACPTACNASYQSGTSVTLTATATSGNRFTGWSGAGCSGSAASCIVNMTAAQGVTATFAPITQVLSVTVTGSGSVGSNPTGINCGSSCTAAFNQGSSVTLAASPEAGYQFAGWTGGLCSGTGTCTVVMSAARTVGASFTQVAANTAALNVVLNGSGSVTSTPAGINCGTACSAAFATGTSVSLSAVPATGYSFTAWNGGGCTGTGACVVALTAATSVAATFTQIKYTLSVSKTGSGTVTSNVGGINCGATCSASLNTGTAVTLTATPASGYAFTGWSGACTGTGTCTTTMNAARSVVASFAQLTYVLSVALTGSGTVTAMPAGINCGTTCTAAYASESTVTLTAVPASGNQFSGWGGACSGTTTNCTVAMTAAKSVTAGFAVVNPGSATNIPLTLVADKAAASNAVVSLGVPFAPGVLSDDTKVAVVDPAGNEVAAYVTTLARWPRDGSLRSVLVAFRASLAQGATANYKLAYGATRTATATTAIAPNPDGPVAATLPASWYSASRVSGLLVPVAANKRFPDFDTALESTLWTIDYTAFGVNCASTTSHRTYYDGPHAMYQLFLRTGDAKHYRRAREEALWYRANELVWYENRAMAVQICQAAGWTPSIAIDWSVLRRMLSQGMLDDHLITGDPAAREAVLGLGEAYRRNLPALTSGSQPSIEATERNLAWPMMGLASYLALDNRAVVRDALVSLVDRALAWQARGTTGAFEHDIVRPDPTECGNGPRGASPFMSSLMVDGLMDYHQLTADTRITEALRKLSTWYETLAITSDKKAFRYLWNCLDDPYDDSAVADLNLLIGHVFGATYALTLDAHWLTFGDAMATSGIEAIYTKRPKQWNQTSRSFGKYLGYRSLGLAP